MDDFAFVCAISDPFNPKILARIKHKVKENRDIGNGLGIIPKNPLVPKDYAKITYMIVILDNVRSALNVGSILRTCDALGIQEAFFCGITPEKDNPKVKKTALGAEKEITVSQFHTTTEAITEAKKRGFVSIGLETGGNSIPISKLPFVDSQIALIVGNEVSGISEEALEQCDYIVAIPMHGVKESLNVSVAFGIAAFELIDTSHL